MLLLRWPYFISTASLIFLEQAFECTYCSSPMSVMLMLWRERRVWKRSCRFNDHSWKDKTADTSGRNYFLSSGVSGTSPPLFLKDHEVSKNSVSALPQNQIGRKKEMVVMWGTSCLHSSPCNLCFCLSMIKKQTFLYVISTWEGMWLGNRPGP